jgi:hypothetical protein
VDEAWSRRFASCVRSVFDETTEIDVVITLLRTARATRNRFGAFGEARRAQSVPHCLFRGGSGGEVQSAHDLGTSGPSLHLRAPGEN